MKYAIIQIGAKQYKVREGDEISVEKLEGQEAEKVSFDQVLLLADKNEKRIGRPNLTDVIVTGKISAQTKGKKIRVATFKAKSRYRRVKGHRQQLTKLVIEKISEKKKSSKKTARK